MKPDQKAQQTQLDELLAFIEECQGEPVNDEIRTNDQEKHHKHPTSQVQRKAEKKIISNLLITSSLQMFVNLLPHLSE